MLPTLVNSSPASPCVVTHLQRPENAPARKSKKSPFATIIANPWVHTVDLILPPALWQLLNKRLDELSANIHYSKVSMTLLQVISGDFFNQYIKSGNILMISEGRPLIDNRYYLKDGILYLELDKPTYERCGLLGKPTRSSGRVHAKSRYLVETNLQQPSMVRGKNGFDRLIWAFSRVLTEPVSWLFTDLENRSDTHINDYSPTVNTLKPIISKTGLTVFPLVPSAETLREQMYQEQLLEWIGLVLIKSERIKIDDKVDPYICRYQFPEAFEETADTKAENLTHLRWHGLIPPRLIRELLNVLESELKKGWFAMGSKSLEGRTCFVVAADQTVISWDMT